MSRRACEAEISKGTVTVNGKKAEIGDKVTPGKDRVVWNGKGIVYRPNTEKIVIALNKPRGYVCTLNDERGRKKVSDLTADVDSRLFPVGRLDMASEGLLLLTNDGELANLLTHPRHHVPKLYRVTLEGTPGDDVLDKLRSMRELDGEAIMPVEVYRVDVRDASTRIDVVLHEGKNRQIRRMCDAVGCPVTRLRRLRIGNVGVSGIAPGKWRKLRDDEVAELKRIAKSAPNEQTSQYDVSYYLSNDEEI